MVGGATRLGPGALIVPTIAVVATMLLAATLERHLDRSHGLFGLAWVEIYAVFRPQLGGSVVMQLAVPGRDRHSGARLPLRLRTALAGHALAAVSHGRKRARPDRVRHRRPVVDEQNRCLAPEFVEEME